MPTTAGQDSVAFARVADSLGAHIDSADFMSEIDGGDDVEEEYEVEETARFSTENAYRKRTDEDHILGCNHEDTSYQDGKGEV